MLSDERWVPENSERSNTRLLRERLLVNRASAANFLPLYTPAQNPEDKLDKLAAPIDGALPIDILLLGMGADMHTASLFPGADQLDAALAADAPTLFAMRAPGAPEPRVTLCARALDGAVVKHIVMTGADKRQAYERAIHLTPQEAPVRAVLSGMMVHWAP